jgi:hypothetical protein
MLRRVRRAKEVCETGSQGLKISKRQAKIPLFMEFAASTNQDGHEGEVSSNQSTSGEAETTTHAADLETKVTSLPQTTAEKASTKLALGSTSDHVLDPLPPVINSGQLPIR